MLEYTDYYDPQIFLINKWVQFFLIIIMKRQRQGTVPTYSHPNKSNNKSQYSLSFQKLMNNALRSLEKTKTDFGRKNKSFYKQDQSPPQSFIKPILPSIVRHNSVSHNRNNEGYDPAANQREEIYISSGFTKYSSKERQRIIEELNQCKYSGTPSKSRKRFISDLGYMMDSQFGKTFSINTSIKKRLKNPQPKRSEWVIEPWETSD